MKVKKLLISAITFFAFINSSLPFTAFSDDVSTQEPAIIVGSDFEDGKAGKWMPFGNCELHIDNSNGHLSETSLKTANRKMAYEGPSYNCSDLILPGQEYTFNGWVYHESSGAQSISFTLKTQDNYGVDSFTQIATAEIEPNNWVNLSGTIPIPEDALSSLVYIECSTDNVNFSIDDFYILGESNNAAGTEPAKTEDRFVMDFEGDFDGWSARGDMTVAHTDEYSKTGTHSIYATNRTKAWNAPMVNISNRVAKGESYYYSAYVMYNGAEYEDSHIFRMELQYSENGVGLYNLISSKSVKKGKWTKIEGYYTIPEDAQNVCLYIQTDNVEDEKQLTKNDTMSYYVDNVTVAKAAVMKKEQNIRNIIIALCSIVIAIFLIVILRVIYKRVKKKNEALELVSKDAMTGSYNRNAYEQRIKELNADTEQCKKLYYALCDVNFLKYLNDNHGHKTGDAAIIRCADILKEIVGKSGKVYRIGGDEFVCMAENPISEKILEAMGNESKIDKGYPFMVASGFAQYDEEKYPSITEIIAQCDKEMYAHKQKIKAENKQFSRK